MSHMKHFTKQLFHFPRLDSYPYSRPKGADVMLITRWLNRLLLYGVLDPNRGARTNVSLVRSPAQGWHQPLMQDMLDGCDAALTFFRHMHQNGIWLTRSVAKLMGECSFKFVQAYSGIAQKCYQIKLARFHMEPSLHYFHHFGVDIDIALLRGDTYIRSPGLDNCESDEDFVGRLARLSRHTHAATLPLRSCERYLLKCHAVFNDNDIG